VNSASNCTPLVVGTSTMTPTVRVPSRSIGCRASSSKKSLPNRYPVNGVVKYLQYKKGLFLHAAHEKASLDNEQMSVGIESGSRRILVRQIAGLIARRIVNYAKAGDAAEQGARMGIIRFGSRVDVFIPTDSAVRIKVGERTVAGTTVLAELGT